MNQPPEPPSPRGPNDPPPGLRAQIGATREAAMALAVAHVDLAKAEAGAIAGEVGRVAALAALAIVLVIFAVFLLVIGVSLSMGQLLLGSMAWGVIHGVLLFCSLALAAILLALGTPGGRLGVRLLISIAVGLVVGVVFGLNLPNQLYASIAESLSLGVDPANQPLVVGAALGSLIGLIAGLIVAIRMPGSPWGRIGAFILLTVLGVAVGAFTAITFGPQVGAGIGITVGYVIWIVLMAIEASNVDPETLKLRFYPTQTIETSKETLEWLQKRMPPGIGS
ncbi:MAG: hypothetical protein E4H24_01200 [Thermomicrobiales bacterium]|nr:MAG: hypothetical protein E4H24_01200 [Thermomicrobiales bacterium]